MSQKKQIWAQYGGQYYLEYPSIEHKQLENAIYTVRFNPNNGQFYLEKVADSYQFDYKLYGLETKLVERVVKTYKTKGTGNLGILLNGVKGTGKTVTSKIIANQINQPTIVVSDALKGVQHFLNSIPQDITIFIDEYEKIFGQSNEMLTIMDGAMNSEFRRLFLLTTNKLFIEENLKERPSRIRYLKEFKDLTPSVVEEIVDDILINKELKNECVKFMTTLSLITVDIVKEILNEVNIHNESPFEFGDIFNVSKVENKYKVYELNKTGQETLLIENVDLYPRPNFANEVGYWFEVNGRTIGQINSVIGPDTLAVDIIEEDENEENVVVDTIVLKVLRSYGVHSNYAYVGTGEYGYGKNLNAEKSTERAKELMGLTDKSETKLELKNTVSAKVPFTIDLDFGDESDSMSESAG
jgi:broad-specificity NMP kinase